MSATLNTIMLIEDDEMTMSFNKMVIEKSRIAKSILMAYNGRDALDMLRNISALPLAGSAPELILLDLHMPVMDGWKFMDEFQRLQHLLNPRPKVVMLSGMFEEVEKIKMQSHPNIAGIKTKPLTIATFGQLVKEVFE